MAVAGALGSTGDFNVATTAFTVASGTGDTAVGGTFSVAGASTLTGAATLSSTLDVTGATTLSDTWTRISFQVAGTKFTVDSLRKYCDCWHFAVTGATVTFSSLGLNGAATISDDITMTKQSAAQHTMLQLEDLQLRVHMVMSTLRIAKLEILSASPLMLGS